MQTSNISFRRSLPSDVALAIYADEPGAEALERFRAWLQTLPLEEMADLCLGPRMNRQALSILESDPRMLQIRSKQSRLLG